MRNINIINNSKRLKIIFVFLLFFAFLPNAKSQEKLVNGTMVQEFYALNYHKPFWFSTQYKTKKAAEWLHYIETAAQIGLLPNQKYIQKLKAEMYSTQLLNHDYKMQLDTQITFLILNFLKDVNQGTSVFKYDEISVNLSSNYVHQLWTKKWRQPVAEFVAQLDCKDHDYLVLKKYLRDSVSRADTFKYNSVMLAMNFRRFITLNYQSEYIIVNIAMAEVFYFRSDSLKLRMRAVVGRIKNQTPQIASYITSIVTFPYWNVPHSIAVKEMLPKVKQDDSYLEQNNLEVIDAKGNHIDELELNWNSYGEKNFPYYFRQSTGADNALGVLKFNLQNPFSIFLHATSWQGVFAKENRFLSHGCVRLEKPFELANEILRGKLDIEKLKSEEDNTKSKTLMIPDKIPTYLIYSPAVVVGEKVVFYPDYYEITNNKFQIQKHRDK